MDSHQEEQERVIEEEDGDGGWVDTHHYATDGSVTQMAEAVAEMTLDTKVTLLSSIIQNIKMANYYWSFIMI